jgi:hypothetical protein
MIKLRVDFAIARTHPRGTTRLRGPMKRVVLSSVLVPALLGVASAALAQADVPHSRDVKKTNLLDHSNSSLIDSATAKAVLTDNIPARLWLIHSPGAFAFLSQVEGGLNPQRTCVVTARVMMLPLTGTLNVPMWRPQPKMTATAFDAQANSSTDQCKALAKDKLKEATLAIVSGIVKI